MIQKIKKFLVVGLAGLSLLAPAGLVMPVLGGVASADIVGQLCNGADSASGATGADKCASGTHGDASSGLKNVAKKITDLFSIIVGAASVIMIVYGGFRYITSGGDSGKVGNAKNTLIYAIVGLVIVALAQLIVRFVIGQAQNTTSNF
jgi:hypothetical protein